MFCQVFARIGVADTATNGVQNSELRIMEYEKYSND